MGVKQVDLVYPGAMGPTALTPAAKDGAIKMFQLSRTETAGVLKAVLPAQSTILGFLIYGTASNAGTSATISIGSTAANANEYVNAQDIKTAGGLVIPTSTITSAIPTIEPVPLTGQDITIYAKYTESGTVSSAGGPWKIAVWYVT